MTLPETSALTLCFISDQVLPTDESVEHKKSHRQSHRKKVLPEIYLTRLLSTKVGAGAAAPRQGGWWRWSVASSLLWGRSLSRGGGSPVSCVPQGTAGSLGSCQLSSSPLEQQRCCVKPPTIFPGCSGACAHGADHLSAHGRQFRCEPTFPARDPTGKGEGGAKLWEQGEHLCDLNSDLSLPTLCECSAPAVGLPAHLSSQHVASLEQRSQDWPAVSSCLCIYCAEQSQM